MQLRTQKNSHSNNHKRWGSRGGRFRSKLMVGVHPRLERRIIAMTEEIQRNADELQDRYAQILEEETERLLPVIDENEA